MLDQGKLIDGNGASVEAKDNIGIVVKIDRGFAFPRLADAFKQQIIVTPYHAMGQPVFPVC